MLSGLSTAPGASRSPRGAAAARGRRAWPCLQTPHPRARAWSIRSSSVLGARHNPPGLGRTLGEVYDPATNAENIEKCKTASDEIVIIIASIGDQTHRRVSTWGHHTLCLSPIIGEV